MRDVQAGRFHICIILEDISPLDVARVRDHALRQKIILILDYSPDLPFPTYFSPFSSRRTQNRSRPDNVAARILGGSFYALSLAEGHVVVRRLE